MIAAPMTKGRITLENVRTDHLIELTVPTLILQGERDPFGRPEEVAAYPLPATISVSWMADGDHGFKPRKKSGYTLDAHIQDAVQRIDGLIDRMGAITKQLKSYARKGKDNLEPAQQRTHGAC